MRIAIAALVSMAACGGGGAKPAVDPHPDPNAGGDHAGGAPAVLHGTVRTQAAGFCGGAYMPNREGPKPEPAAGAAVIIRAGATNSDAAPIATVTTKADGTYEASLSSGTFCVVLAEKKDRPKASQYTDQACLDQYWKQCDAVVHLPSDAPGDVLHVSSCFGPCYHGPLPP
jgi:hypothetical protein